MKSKEWYEKRSDKKSIYIFLFSFFIFNFLFICLFVCLFIYSLIYLFTYLFIYLFIYLSIYFDFQPKRLVWLKMSTPLRSWNHHFSFIPQFSKISDPLLLLKFSKSCDPSPFPQEIRGYYNPVIKYDYQFII